MATLTSGMATLISGTSMVLSSGAGSFNAIVPWRSRTPRVFEVPSYVAMPPATDTQVA
jgi:hypothetical protein